MDEYHIATQLYAGARERNSLSQEQMSTAILRAKPASAKGKYVQSAYMSSTMGPGVALDLAALEGKQGA